MAYIVGFFSVQLCRSTTIYWREPRRPTEQDQKIVEQITHLAAVAIERKRNEASLTRALDEIAKSEAELRTIIDAAVQKVRLAEDGWNSRDPEKVSPVYKLDSRWRNRSEFIKFNHNRIAVRFAYEWHDDSGHWYRSYGDENWEFDESGLMLTRHGSINDLPIKESDRKYHWALGRGPDDHPGLSDLGL